MVGKTFAHCVVLERAGVRRYGCCFSRARRNPDEQSELVRHHAKERVRGFVNVDSPGRRGQGQKKLRAQPVFSLLRPLTEP